MKITKVQLSSGNLNITPSSTQKPTDDFSSYLEEILGQGKNEGVRNNDMANETMPVLNNNGLDDLVLSGKSFRKITENLNSAVDQLEILANLLASPDSDLKQIDNFIEAMAKLDIGGEDVTSTNIPSLKLLEEEIKMCSFLESVKWKRGDYL